MNSFTAFLEKIDNLTIRERAVIMVGVLVVIYSLWNSVLMQPLYIQQKKIKAEMQQKHANQIAMNVEIQKIFEDRKKDPNLALEEELRKIKEELNAVNNEIQNSTVHLVSPKNMAKILETVLYKTRGLKLISAKGLGATALIKSDENKSAANKNMNEDNTIDNSGEDMGNAYTHGLRVEFDGDYMSTLNYLRELESLEQKFFWDSFEYNVIEYPRARISIQVFTLSLDKNWIDV